MSNFVFGIVEVMFWFLLCLFLLIILIRAVIYTVMSSIEDFKKNKKEKEKIRQESILEKRKKK